MRGEISNEVRAKEIHAKARSYYDVAEQYAYKFLMELKTLRDERLFRELGYSSFEKYCDGEWGVTRQLMNQRIQLADEFGEKVENQVSTFGHSKSLLLARMDPEVRADVMENGVPTETGRKPAEEATRAEIEAYQRSLKEKEAEIERLEIENEQLAKQADKPPEIRTEYIEVDNTPHDYETTKQRLEEYRAKFGDLENYDEHITATHRQDMIVAVMSFSQGVREFIKRYDYMTKYKSVIDNLDEESKQQYDEAVEALKEMAGTFDFTLKGNIVFDAEYNEIN